MVALRLIALVLLVGSMALPASADIFPYEAVGSAGDNGAVDSNALSCDSVEGCYTATGTKCSDNPSQLCDLQRIPAGRCTYGSLTGGLNSCVWPHRAGRCTANNKVGCLTSAECSGLTPNTCDLTFDKFGRAADPNDVASCTCTDANATSVCGGTLSVCSDGDPLRGIGGNGVGLGVQLNVTTLPTASWVNMGPGYTGSGPANSTPPYGIENPPNIKFDPQRDAGSIQRGGIVQGTGTIHLPRATDAREIETYTHPTIADPNAATAQSIASNVRKITSLGDSYWGDWVTISFNTTQTYNTHIVTYSCDPPGQGWDADEPVTGSLYCHEAARNGISFVWANDLTPAQKTAYTVAGQPVCPPHCYKDFNHSTMESEEFAEVGTEDPNAGIQLAIQSGEPDATRVAGARDVIGVAAVTSITYLVDNDMRCRMGGWGNADGYVGRCANGASACNPSLANCGMGGACCAGQGNGCVACNGPITPGNPLGLPIGYDTHGYSQLDLVAGERIGGIPTLTGADVKVVLFVVGTTGNAAADFRDIVSEGGITQDLAFMGPVDAGQPFAPGIGSGGTFNNGTTLNIGEPCCLTGANVNWDPANLGVTAGGASFPVRYGPGGGDVSASQWNRVYDKGPGPDGIPGCMGDNATDSLGALSCNNRLGQGTAGAKTDPYYATGQDDYGIMRPVGSTSMPAVGAKWRYGDASAATVAHFGLAQNPPTTNTASAFTLRDVDVLGDETADVLVKVNTTQCPLTATGPVCVMGPPIGGGAPDGDGDGVPDATDNCPTVANAGQEDGGNGIPNGTLPGNEASPFDGVGNACDNCVNVNNPIVPGGAAAFLVANPWATLTGGQRDDDHDGYGNICDGDFNNSATTTIADTNQYKASLGETKTGDTCGTTNARPCAIFDINSANSTESSATGPNNADTARYKLLLGNVPGPRCPTCPLACEAGASGNCF
jgi:hypothetical protein